MSLLQHGTLISLRNSIFYISLNPNQRYQMYKNESMIIYDETQGTEPNKINTSFIFIVNIQANNTLGKFKT